jgi:hypothetical protein
MSTHERPLGMLPPTDDYHRLVYPLTAGTAPEEPRPAGLGTPWYRSFDDPEERVEHGRRVYYIGLGSDWGPVRGGHAICISSPHIEDNPEWWAFYDQLNEGACTGFMVARMETQVNRRRYDGFDVYYEARKRDEWPGEDYDGTSVRAACDVAREEGLRPSRRIGGAQVSLARSMAEGIEANRWITSVEDLAACLSPADSGKVVLDRGYVELLNSWGRADYPHRTRMPLEAVYRLAFQEDGELVVFTDR